MSKELEKLLRKAVAVSGTGKPGGIRLWWTRALGRWRYGVNTRRVRVDSRSARDLLARVRSLRGTEANWPQILSTVNPRNDRVAADLLTKLRGPHQFAPHVALNVLVEGCERVIIANQRASDIDALREALRRSEVVTKFGD